MKQILIQLDTDPHPSPFDQIVAYDAGVDAIISYGGVTPDAVADLVQGAFFTRGPKDLHTLAIWVGGSNVALGEEVLAAVQATFFGPFQVSVMLDCDGCNTTAAAGVARIERAIDLAGKRAVIVGAGPVGLRSAVLLRGLGAEVTVCGLPREVFGDRPYRRARGLGIAEGLGLPVLEPADGAALAAALEGASAVLAAAPAGLEVLPKATWSQIASIEVLADYSATEPVGIEGVGPHEDMVEHDGKLVLGALAIGGPKMKVHRACVRRLFEQSDLVLDVDGVYAVASEPA